MKRILQGIVPLIAATALAFAVVGCGKDSSAEARQEIPQATAESAEAAVKPYPLKTCVVADEELGSMGDPFVFVYEGQEYKLCCKGCLKDFHKEPAKYVAKVQAAK